jgi:hypothetical protein
MYFNSERPQAVDKQGFCWLCHRLLNDASVLGPKCFTYLSNGITAAFDQGLIDQGKKQQLLQMLRRNPAELKRLLTGDAQLQAMLQEAKQNASIAPDVGYEAPSAELWIVGDDAELVSEAGEDISEEEGDWDSGSEESEESAESYESESEGAISSDEESDIE